MDARAIVIAAVSAKRLGRNPSYRVRSSGEGLLISAPTRHRPILKIYASPMQRRLWEFFAEPAEVSAAIDHLRKSEPDLDPWDVVWAVTNLERQGALVATLSEGAPGLAWPAWRAAP